MITKELAMTLPVGTVLWHSTAINDDGTPLRARVNGACKTWKTRPDAWYLPMKYGLKNCFPIGSCFNPQTDSTKPEMWSLPEHWAIERHYKGETT